MKAFFYHPLSNPDGYSEPPLGLAYLMDVARKKGWDYEFYDENHHSFKFPLDRIFKGFTPDVIAISMMTPQYIKTQRAVEDFRKRFPRAKIIIGGPHPTALPAQTLTEFPGVDYLAAGEGEKTFAEFLEFMEGERDIESINGLFYRKNGEVVSNPPRELMTREELNQAAVDYEKLYEHGPYKVKLSYTDYVGPGFTFITARGCPNKCTFCDEGNIWKGKVRMRDIDSVVEEVEYLVERWGAKYFNILDDTFIMSTRRVKEFCERVKPLNIKFRITSTIRGMNEEILAALKDSGCELIAYGVESGDNEVLRIMKKRQTTDEIKETFAMTKKYGILSYALCMVGNIGEDMDAVRRTAALIKEIEADLMSCSIMIPYPGSENYRVCKENGWLLHTGWENWMPSVLKTKDFAVVARTDKMDADEILRAYYFMNRTIVTTRFRHKYGKYFYIMPDFYINEIMPRMKSIGPAAFLRHAARMFARTEK